MKICLTCKKELDESKFEKHRKECKKCRYEKRKQTHTLICQYCSLTFKTSRLKQKYCNSECQGKALRKDKALILKEIEQKNFLLMNDFNVSRDILELQCLKCGYEFKTSVNNLLIKRSNCKKCLGLNKKTTEEFIEIVHTLVGDEYEVLGEYKGNTSKILMIHNVCGNKYKVSPDKFTQGRRCPVCKSSHGELAIRSYLISNNIEFKEQWTHPECKYVGLLRFDFAIFKDKKLKALIEFDGEQHFMYKNFFHGKKGFEESLLRDSIKDNFCAEKHIDLLRIPFYKMKEIEVTLDKYFEPTKIPSQA